MRLSWTSLETFWFRMIFPNETEGYDSLLAKTGKEAKVAFEATYAWEYVFEELEDRVEEIKLAHPKRTEVITKVKIKTDVRDSEALAHLLRANLIPEVYVPCDERRELRKIVKRRGKLVMERSKYKNRIRAELRKRGIDSEGYYLGTQKANGRDRIGKAKGDNYHPQPPETNGGNTFFAVVGARILARSSPPLASLHLPSAGSGFEVNR